MKNTLLYTVIPCVLLICGGLLWQRNQSELKEKEALLAQESAKKKHAEVVIATPVPPPEPTAPQDDANSVKPISRGSSISELRALKGQPRSSLKRGNLEILTYDDFTYTLSEGIVIEMSESPRPKPNVRTGIQAPSHETRQSKPTTSIRPASANEGVATEYRNPNIYKTHALDKATEWARVLCRDRGWYYPNFYVRELGVFTPVTGWQNRYSAQGRLQISHQHGTFDQRFEATLQLNDDGSLRDIDISSRN